MRFDSAHDWRDAVAYDSPTVVADVAPGDDTRCSACGAASAPRPRSELWVIKHRHPTNHHGYVRFYCRAHLPVIERPRPAAPERPARSRGRAAPREPRATARRAAPAVEKPRAMCPNCFIEVSATGDCGMCGARAD